MAAIAVAFSYLRAPEPEVAVKPEIAVEPIVEPALDRGPAPRITACPLPAGAVPGGGCVETGLGVEIGCGVHRLGAVELERRNGDYAPTPVEDFLDPDDPTLFPRLTPDQVEYLAKIGTHRSFARGDLVFEHGQRETPCT